MKAQHLLICESTPIARRALRVLSARLGAVLVLVLVTSFLAGCEGTMVTPTVTWLPADAPVPPIVAESAPDDVTGKTESEGTAAESESTDPAMTPSSVE